MANEAQLKILEESVVVWNEFRHNHSNFEPDLRGASLQKANLRGADLQGADLRRANLQGADLSGAILHKANLSKADLQGVFLQGAALTVANLYGADLRKAILIRADLDFADLSNANLSGAELYDADLSNANLSRAFLHGVDLVGANLSGTNFTEADLTKADLQKAMMTETQLHQATLNGCKIYGISAWNLKGVPKQQSGLIITPFNEPTITVDDLQVAQFIYLLLNNQNVRRVIDTITSKAVLILGRFTSERKEVLNAILAELRNRNYLPILFDFEGAANRDITETVSTLAHMARFVIADITDAKSIPQELQAIVPNLPSVPVQPLLLSSQTEYGMFEHFKRYPWVLKTYLYDNVAELIASISSEIITPLEAKVGELRQ